MTASAATIDNVITPVPRKVRIQALDVIRGLSILGILAVNADGFAAPQSASLNPRTWLFPNEGWTAFSYWVMDTFFHDKFVTLFSMLFGVSLFLVGGERSDKRKGAILARRLAVLFAFAMLHGFGIWWGDILSLYAVTGALMFFCRSWRASTLLWTGIALYAANVAYQLPAAEVFSSRASVQNVEHQQGNPTSISRRQASIKGDLADAKGSWAGAYRINTKEYLRLLSGDPWLMVPTLGLMMIGLGLFKQGFLAGRASARRYADAIVVGIPALAIIGWLCWRADVLLTPVPANHALVLSLSPLVSLGYASCLVLMLRTSAAGALAPLAAAGRMAFTNYLSQSLIMTTIFYGGRGALMGEIDRPGLWAITVAIWVLQLIWSPLWLSRFEMGPFEWAWRCLTLGRTVPLVKPSRN